MEVCGFNQYDQWDESVANLIMSEDYYTKKLAMTIVSYFNNIKWMNGYVLLWLFNHVKSK